jgi:HlyD family secretion protein
VVKRWKLAASVVLVGAAAAWAANHFIGGVDFTLAANQAPSTSNTQPEGIAALGRVEPQSEIVNVSSGISDRLESLLVRRGDLVLKDQLLGRLQGYAEQAAQRDQIAAQLAEAKIKLKTEIELDTAKIESAEIKLRQIKEVFPLKITAQEATITGIEAGLANNRLILAAEVHLLAKYSSSQRNHDNQKSVVLQGEANLAVAQARLAELNRQFELDRLDAESQIRLAKAALERAKADFAIDSLTKQIELAETRVQRMTIYAPIAGRILNVLARPGELVGSAPVLSMGNTEKMRVVAEVYETDITRVQLGQRATVTSRALTTPASGTVVEIGNMIFKNDVLNVDPAAKADARVVEVRIELDDAKQTAHLTNLTVDVLIQTAAPPNAGLQGVANK